MAWLSTIPVLDLPLTHQQVNLLFRRYMRQLEGIKVSNKIKTDGLAAYYAMCQHFRDRQQEAHDAPTNQDARTHLFEAQVYYNDEADKLFKEGMREQQEQAWDAEVLWKERNADVVARAGQEGAERVGTLEILD
jgi:hypothetical protein